MERLSRTGFVLLLAGLLALGSAGAARAQSMNDVAYDQDAYAANRPLAPPPWDKAASFVLSMSSLMFNTIVFPVKLAVGITGAEMGGIAGAMSGGDEETAAGIWNVTTDGSYFTTPQILDGRDTFYYTGDSP